MTTTDDLTTVRLSGPAGLLAAIPAMLGFHPQESLVLVCLSGPRQRLGPVIRIDLEVSERRPGAEPGGAELRRYAAQYADEVALVCYTAGPDRPEMLDRVLSALLADGVDLLDVMIVRGDRAYPAHLGRTAVEGIQVPGPDHPQVRTMTAVSALHGRAILPDRTALRKSIAGPSGTAARGARAAMRQAADQLIAALGASGPLDRRRLRRLLKTTVEQGLQHAAANGDVPVDLAALLALLLSDVRTRDEMVARAVRELDRPWLVMLIAVARAVLDEDAAQTCAVLALTAYHRGDGALAQVAIDRCLAAEPKHRLAHLMMQAMAAGLPPGDMLRLTADSLTAGMDE